MIHVLYSVILGVVKQLSRMLVEEYLGDTDGTTSVFFNSNVTIKKHSLLIISLSLSLSVALGKIFLTMC